jgi:Protein of unknown function (DUF1566)
MHVMLSHQHTSTAMSPLAFLHVRSAIFCCAFSLLSASASAQAVEFVIFTGENSGVSTVDDLSTLQAKGKKVVCGALGDATRIACGAVGQLLRLDIEIASAPSSGPAFMMTRANRMTILPLPIKLAQSVRPNDGIRPIATTGPALSILGQNVPSISSTSGVNRAQVERARDERISAEQNATQPMRRTQGQDSDEKLSAVRQSERQQPSQLRAEAAPQWDFAGEVAYDPNTNLTWRRCPRQSDMQPDGTCDKATGAYDRAASQHNHSGWRLPTTAELVAVLKFNRQRYDWKARLFPVPGAYIRWVRTSTDDIVYFDTASVDKGADSKKYEVILVRDGR